MDPAGLLEVAHATATAVRGALDALDDWGPAGTRPGQYRSDLAADAVAVGLLLDAGLGVLSEESGLQEADRPLLAVLDPVDGSTNAARGLPRYATSTCILDADGPLVAVVADQATGVRYEAVRGGGARRDGLAIGPSRCDRFGRAVVGLSGWPDRYLGWRQYRALGSAALDLCAVADGSLDAWIDCTRVPGSGAHGVWDYAGALLVCAEAGAPVVDVDGRDLIGREAGHRRTPVAAATPQLLAEILASLGSR